MTGKIIDIPGRLHSIAVEGQVTGANEIFDDSLQKDQATINQEVQEAIGIGGSVDFKIATAKSEIIGDAGSEYNTLGKLEDKVQAETAARQSADTALGNRITPLEQAVGTGGSVDSRISAAVATETTRAQGAESALQGSISAETERAQGAETALDGRIDTLEEAVGSGGSVDERISAAVSVEQSRAQSAESALSTGKADKATTIAGYGITDAYTKSETYTKTEVNGLVDTPHQEYVTVDAYANLPVTGSKDTIYRVSNYNGSTSQVDASVYSEYAWDGSQYVFLCVKSQIGEVFDISVYNNTAKYVDLAAALNGGANIPQSLQKGGMSVKFVQSSDNKYVQYRLMADEWGTNTEDWSFCGNDVYVDSPEFLEVTTDSEDKVLEGIRQDGTKVVGGNLNVGGSASISGDIRVLGNMEVFGVSYKVVENSEYLAVWLDAEDKIIFGFKADGKTYIGDADFLNEINDIKAFIKNVTDKNIDWDALSSITAVENPEFIEAKTDSESKILAGRTPDGAAFENVGISTPKVSIGGHTIENVEDPEGRSEVTTDSESKIISYRDAEGVKHENVGIETNHLGLSEDGMTEFQQALIDSGFNPKMPIDWSDSDYIQIPLPTSLPIVNINIPYFPTSKEDEIDGTMEFMDKSGNYFKKNIEGVGLQGSSSLSAPKKNLKFDFTDCSMKIGDWVAQDSYHLKAWYFDVFRGKANVAYDYWREIIEYNRPNYFSMPWLNISKLSYYNGIGSFSKEFNNEVRLTPAGFPISLYINGEYYGIATWNIKKAQENYSMSKANTSNVHIDPADIGSMLAGISIDWTKFELRNPKPKKKKDGWELVDVDGNAYNPDAPLELMGTDSPNYDSANQSHVKTSEVKDHIIDFKDICAEVIANNNKETFEQYFDVNWFIDFVIWSNAILDGDGIVRNTQYLYWGNKWYIAPYDCDQIFGNTWQGNYISRTGRPVDSLVMGRDGNNIFSVFFSLYKTDIDNRYRVLRDSGILTQEHICSKLKVLINAIGKDEYAKDFAKWPQTPCYRTPNDAPQWEYQGDYYEGTPVLWDANTRYTVGQYVYVMPDGSNVYYYKCKENNLGVRPYTDEYSSASPMLGGFFDSLARTELWIEKRFLFLDIVFDYNV